MEQEPGASGKSVGERYVRVLFSGHKAKALPSSGDKVVRAAPYAAQQQAGNVYLCRRLTETGYVRPEWWEPFIEEHRQFPHGAHDDQVDTASLAFLDLAARPKAKATTGDSQRLRSRRLPGR